MKTTPKEAKEEAAEQIGAADTQPEYPWGLTLNIDDATMAKLGMKELPPVGTKVAVTAMAEVCNTSQYATVKGESEASFSLQITDMAAEPQGVDIADRLYSKKA